MELSIFIAKIYGLAFTAVGLGMLINDKYYRKTIEDLIKSPGVLFLGGTFALIAGFLIITYHNLWVKDWMVIITIFGWIGFIKGVSLLVFPKISADLSVSITKKGSFTVWSIIVLILGLVTGYFGFMA